MCKPLSFSMLDEKDPQSFPRTHINTPNTRTHMNVKTHWTQAYIKQMGKKIQEQGCTKRHEYIIVYSNVWLTVHGEKRCWLELPKTVHKWEYACLGKILIKKKIVLGEKSPTSHISVNIIVIIYYYIKNLHKLNEGKFKRNSLNFTLLVYTTKSLSFLTVSQTEQEIQLNS